MTPESSARISLRRAAAAGLLSLVLALSAWGVTPRDEDAGEPAPKPAHGALSSVSAMKKAPPPAPANATPAAAAVSADGYQTIGFDLLAGFPFDTPQATATPDSAPVTKTPAFEPMAQVPDAVKKLDDQKVIVSGFMLPTKIEQGRATEFLLLNSPMMCCFGATPATNAWIVVKIPGGVAPVQDVVLPFRGRLHVRPQWDNGWLSSIYQLDAEGLATKS